VSDDEAFQRFMDRGYSKKTLGGYDKKWSTWLDYCKARKESGLNGDVLMKGIGSNMDKTMVYVRFIWFLIAAIGIVPTAINTYLAAVKKGLGERGVCTEFADDRLPLVKRAKQAAKKRTRAELREALLKKEARLKLPFFDLLTEWIVEKFWEGTTWDWNGTFLRLICLAIILMDLFGFRESNVVRPRPDGEDHTLRAEDFHVAYNDRHGQSRVAVGGSWELQTGKVELGQVTAVHVIVASSKRSVEAVRKTVTPADPRGRRLVMMLLQWFAHSQVQADEMLCTCHRVSEVTGRECVYTLTSEKLAWGIKTAAEQNGYPPEHFASSSMRKGMSSRGGLTGEDEKVTAERGGWKSLDVMHKHYNFAKRVARKAGDTAPLREAEVRSLYFVSKTAISSGTLRLHKGGKG
jgi:phage shock protein PspC (stress-responsive transcriptional regulator)